MTPGLTVRYTPEKQDYVRVSRVLAIHSAGFRVLAVLIAVNLLISLFIVLFPEFIPAGWQNVALILFFVAVFYLFYFFTLVPLQLGSAYRSRAYLRMPREFTFSETTILMKIGDDAVELKWEDLLKVIDASHYYVLIFHNGERVYPFLPKRAFDSDAAHESLLRKVAEKSIRVI